MAEIIKKNWEKTVIVGLVCIVMFVGILKMGQEISRISFVEAATSSVAVSATVNEWLSFSVSTDTVPIAPDLVTAAGGTNIGSSTNITLTAGTNAGGGFSIDIKDANAGLAYGATGTISSASSTLVAGTNGYGAQCTSTQMTVATSYNHWGDTNHTVGGLEVTDNDLLDYSGVASGFTATLKFKAAAATTSPAGTYTDNVTLTCLGST